MTEIRLEINKKRTKRQKTGKPEEKGEASTRDSGGRKRVRKDGEEQVDKGQDRRLLYAFLLLKSVGY